MNLSNKLLIRFDGPPAHESGRFVETELDGKGIGVSFGEWVKDGEFYCLVLPDACAEVVRERERKRLAGKVNPQ